MLIEQFGDEKSVVGAAVLEGRRSHCWGLREEMEWEGVR